MIFLSLGAGVQSTTIFRMMCCGELPKADHAIFADTQWEPEEVYTHLDNLKAEGEKAGLPLHVVTYGDIRKDSLEGYVYNDKSRIGHAFATMPLYSKGYLDSGAGGMLQRQCTNRYKIGPVEKKMKELLGIKTFREAPAGSVHQYFGISADESRRVRTSHIKAIRYFYPFIFENSTSEPLIWKRPGFTRRDCLSWNKAHGFGTPPRSACIGCPYHSNAEWRRIKDDPKQWADAVAFDKAIRKHPIKGECYLHRSMVPLDQADLGEKDPDQIEIECEGLCGF